jgi:hypothetical protein
MRIKKIAPVTPANGNIENTYGTSQENTYSQEYINKFTDYSTTEQVIGKTSAGKTIYRKEFNFTDLPTNTNNDLDTTQITGVDFTKIVKIDGFVKGGGSNFIAPLNTIFSTADLTSGRNAHYAMGTKFRSYVGAFLTGNNKYDLTLWLYYTKD